MADRPPPSSASGAPPELDEGGSTGPADWLRSAVCAGQPRCQVGKVVSLSLPGLPDASVVDVASTYGNPDDPNALGKSQQWLVNRQAHAVIQLLTEAGGQVGSSGLPVRWSVADSTYRYDFAGNGPSIWTGSEAAEIDLSTLTVTHEEFHYSNRMDECALDDETWDPRSFAGTVAWSAAVCAAGPKRCEKHRYTFIPDAKVD
jgi:hypothetical protein